MKLNRKWLNEDFVDLSQVSDKEFVETLTVFGQKVETYERMDAEVKNVVVGKVLSMVRHPNSDHMWICQVDVGKEEPVQIVTGAQNVTEGDLVPVALHNSWLPGGVHITKGKLRGELSNGMLCSFAELGLTQNDFPDAYADGIWILNNEDCQIGQDINQVIGNDDTVVDFEITNNRPDCYSIIGLAREAAAAFGKHMRHHEPVVHGSDAGSIYDYLDVEVPATELCNRYSSRMVANVKIGPSPKWLRQRLRANGVRPINNIVDITNYVMLEYGQPMHAFDYRYVSSGKIVVREAEEGETLTTLDGNVRNLKAGMLVIADENRAIGLAGIMGGENSEIMDDTTMVVFESANFNGTSIRQTALALGMRTEASGKFEKSLDPMMTIPAVQRACELVELLQCGDVLEGTIDVINYVPEPKKLPLECDKINRLLGTDISREDMVKYLNLLEIPVEGDTILVPSFRPDLNLMADIAEEVGRSYGYNEIPTTAFKNATQGGYTPEMLMENKAGVLCRGMGYSEIITYSFVSPAIFDQIRLPGDSPLRNALRIQNPLGEDTSIMRTIALPSMMEILSRNNAYHNKAVKLYELAKIYLPVEGQVLPEEPKMLMLGTYGANETFFTLKGEVEAIFAGLRLKKASYTACSTNPSYHPGRCAVLSIDGEEVGVMGQVHPLVAKNYGIDTDVYCAEINFTKLFACRLPDATYTPLPKYPAVSRDLALVCGEEITVAQAEDVITAAAGKLLRSVKLFDIYRGVGVPEGKKSMAFSLELRADDRTLTDTDSEAVTAKVLQALQEKLGAILR
ncbi:MAG TPA: phenylalanine--tRNA ligase subunit beta [Candidatus Faecousia intestinavium]|nr:phenylalanine--tRNA ligase subunit beta [Candidatus Faecousia intestinavium]